VKALRVDMYDCEGVPPSLDALVVGVVCARMGVPRPMAHTPASKLVLPVDPLALLHIERDVVTLATSAHQVRDRRWAWWLVPAMRGPLVRAQQLRKEVKLAMSDLDGLGDYTWEMEWVDIPLVEVLVRDGRAMRPLPAAWVMGDAPRRAAVRPPYWHTGLLQACVVAGDECQLRPHVLDAVAALDPGPGA